MSASVNGDKQMQNQKAEPEGTSTKGNKTEDLCSQIDGVHDEQTITVCSV
eukprot:CAMPEP_0201575900 /NCGR_PEP_ID=MMETSP0190_2-20130828/21350_1 /ASSEMBLY_ACC=CAM_ASM_000263 /TAXON_ID=37353 /ORGANISM="Rosalina sp." /LENGTH=49 /DNA_ID=CAMNT_0048006091 /DNA_START=902 /DNA_END=1051 /DNA_ORIENTATION=-